MADDRAPLSLRERIRDAIHAAGKFKSLWQYLMFVAVAGVFWLILALNDEAQSDFQVRIEIEGVPDSVTFITDPPAVLNVTVRDKGSALLRRKFMDAPVVRISFAEYASGNRLRVTPSAMMSSLRGIFGAGAGVNITSVDSIGVWYTSSPGRVVPIKVDADVTAALGKVINGNPRLDVREAKIYSVGDIIDTVMYVTTMPVTRRDLADPLKVKVGIRPLKGVRIEPSMVEVTIPVEPLENRKTFVTVTPTGVPVSESLALFPQKVEVSYLVPMSIGDDVPVSDFRVVADYADIAPSSSAMVKVKIDKMPRGVTNASLLMDSIEYTIIRSMP